MSIFADDTTPYTCLPDMLSVLAKHQKGIDKVFIWINQNLMACFNKCHQSTSSEVLESLIVLNLTIENESRVKPLGINLIDKLRLLINAHIESVKLHWGSWIHFSCPNTLPT